MGQLRVIIPTFNAERHFGAVTEALSAQGIAPSDLLVVDSSSHDRTAQLFSDYGAEVIRIEQRLFNHGGTRRMAALHCSDAAYLVLLTQDAIPQPRAFERLLTAFNDPDVGMAYGRQLPRPQARAIERHARLKNYPAMEGIQIRSLDDRIRLGVKTTFSSNSFAAYRTAALAAVGWFPAESFFGEDQITAGRMLMAGWKLAYVGDAAAVHSHGYSIVEDFKRYFDVGIFHSRNAWLLETFGNAEGEGLAFVKSELRYLLGHEPASIPSALVRTLTKYVGYRLGRLERRLAVPLKRRLSMSSYYW